MTRRDPDHGDLDGLHRAAWAVEDLAAALHQSRLDATTATGTLTGEVWSGRGAGAFLAAAGQVDTTAGSTVDGWTRLAATVTDYASSLQLLQNDGDDIRHRLDLAEQARDDTQQRIGQARTRARQSDPSALVEVAGLTGELHEAQTAVARELALLDELDRRRRLLDQRTVDQLHASPGPGAAAWSALTRSPRGTPRPVTDVIDDLLDLIGPDGRCRAEDYAVIDRFLASHSQDTDAMARFYEGLGPSGLLRFLEGMSAANLAYGTAQARTLPQRLSTGLVTASLTWDARTARFWGKGLVDGIAEADFGQTAHRRLIVTLLLGAEGLDPRTALGAMDRIEQLRRTEPDVFARLAPDGGPLPTDLIAAREAYPAVAAALDGRTTDLMGAVFGQLTHLPALARDLLTGSAGATDYWFGERDWGANGFEGPAGLLDAIVSDPSALNARHTDPLGTTWSGVAAFASRAVEALGGNLHLRVGTMSEQASVDVAHALGVFVPETAGRLGGGVDFDFDNEREQVTIVLDERVVGVPSLTSAWGNLDRLLGIATTDPRAAATYQARVAAYATQVLDHLTSPNHPDLDTAKNLAYGIGGLFGMAFASGAYEAQKHAGQVSDAHREALSTISAVAALIPGVSTGSDAADYVVQIASGQAESVAAAIDPAIVSPDQLRATLDAGLVRGNTLLDQSVGERLTTRWPTIDPPYDTAAATLTGRVADGYAWTASAAAADVTAPGLDVVVLGEDTPRNRADMP